MKSTFTFIKNKTLYVWKIPMFPALFLTNFILGLSVSFVGPFYSIFGIDEVGMSNIAFGIFMTVMSIGGVIVSTFLGKLSDSKVTRKNMLIATCVAGIIGYICFAFIREYFTLLIVGTVILGIATSMGPQLWAYARVALKQTDVPDQEAPYVMNVFRMFFALSWTVGPALAAWILLIMGFEFLFLFVAFGYVVAALVIIFTLKNVPQPVSTQQPINLGKFICTPHICANIVGFLLLFSAGSISMMNLPQFVTKVLNGSEMHVGIIFSIPPVFEVPLMIAAGILATKWDNGRLIRIGFFIALLYFSLLMLATEPWHIYPIQILNAAQVSITTGIAVTYFQNFIPNEPGTATTLFMNTMKIGSILGFLLFGLLSEYLGYRSVFIVCSISTAIGFILLVAFGKEKLKFPTSKGIQA